MFHFVGISRLSVGGQWWLVLFFFALIHILLWPFPFSLPHFYLNQISKLWGFGEGLTHYQFYKSRHLL
jgi:hypothetical protein